ncbi:hypothetical protein AAC387_Pa09g0405 [Persea americana]
MPYPSFSLPLPARPPSLPVPNSSPSPSPSPHLLFPVYFPLLACRPLPDLSIAAYLLALPLRLALLPSAQPLHSSANPPSLFLSFLLPSSSLSLSLSPPSCG